MIKRLRKRFIVIMIVIAAVLLGILFISIPLLEFNLARSNASMALNVVLDKPEEILSPRDNPSSLAYSAFYVNRVGTITRYFSMEYNRNQLENIYREILYDHYGDNDMMLEKSHLYYNYAEKANGT